MDQQPTAPATNPEIPAYPSPTKPSDVTGNSLPGVPATWPGAFGVYKYSRQAVKLNLGPIIVLLILTLLVGFGLPELVGRLGQLISFLLNGLLTAAFTLLLIAGVRGQRLSLGQAFSDSLPLWLKMIGLTLLVALSLIASLFFFIVPFFFVLPRLILAPYFLVDKKLDVLEAYQASWAATKGHAGKMWGIIGVTFLMTLLMLTIIGIPVAIYLLVMYYAAEAVLYEFINKAGPQAAPALQSPPAAAPQPPTTPPAAA